MGDCRTFVDFNPVPVSYSNVSTGKARKTLKTLLYHVYGYMVLNAYVNCVPPLGGLYHCIFAVMQV